MIVSDTKDYSIIKKIEINASTNSHAFCINILGSVVNTAEIHSIDSVLIGWHAVIMMLRSMVKM